MRLSTKMKKIAENDPGWLKITENCLKWPRMTQMTGMVSINL